MPTNLLPRVSLSAAWLIVLIPAVESQFAQPSTRLRHLPALSRELRGPAPSTPETLHAVSPSPLVLAPSRSYIRRQFHT